MNCIYGQFIKHINQYYGAGNIIYFMGTKKNKMSTITNVAKQKLHVAGLSFEMGYMIQMLRNMMQSGHVADSSLQIATTWYCCFVFCCFAMETSLKIEELHTLPCLRDVKSTQYKNRDKRREAMKSLSKNILCPFTRQRKDPQH